MPDPTWTDAELIAWIDEMLPADRMAALETDLRDNESLKHRIAGLSKQRDSGIHAVGEIWRRERLSCPGRAELGSFLLGTLEQSRHDYIDFHLRTVGCRICGANLRDLEDQSRDANESTARRRRFFESSAGYLNQPPAT